MYENRKWVIVTVSAITDDMIASAIQTSTTSLKTFCKSSWQVDNLVLLVFPNLGI